MNVWRLAQLLIVVACVSSALAVLVATSRGIGLSPDSLQYLAAGVSASSGGGLTTFGWDGEPVPLTHFPPLYPLVLAAAHQVGVAPEAFARWFNVGLFVLTIALAAAVARRLAPRSNWAAPTVACACAAAHDLIVVHSMAWSEPLYLTLTLGGLLALGGAIDRGSWRLLIVALTAAGAAAAVRYVGVANVAVVALAVTLWWRGAWLRRVATAAALSVIGALPLVITFAAQGESGGIANRELAWHPLTAVDLRMAVAVIGKWVTPSNDAGAFTAVWLLVFAALLGVVLAERSDTRATTERAARRSRLQQVLLVFAAMYVAVFALAMSLVDAQTVFEPRHLTPLFLTLLVLGMTWLARQSAYSPAMRLAMGGIVAAFLSANTLRMLPWLREAHANGLALRRVEDDAVAVLNATRQLPNRARLFSNDPYFMRVHTSRMVSGLPRERDPNSLRRNRRFEQQVQAICASAVSHPTFLVLLDMPVNPDSTASANLAARSGHARFLPGGMVIRVWPHCAPPATMHATHGEAAPAAATRLERDPDQ